MIRLFPDNAIHDAAHGQVVNSTCAADAQSPLVQAIAEALSFKGGMQFPPDAPEILFSTQDYLVRIDGQPYPPDADTSGLSEEAQAFHQVVYAYNDGEYAAQYALLNAAPEPVEPEPLTPERAAQIKRAQIDSDFQSALSPISQQYPIEERDGWPQQLEEVRVYRADPEALTPTLDAMLTTGPESTKEALVMSIEAKVAEYAQVYGAALGIKRSRSWALDQIDLNAPDAITQIAAI